MSQNDLNHNMKRTASPEDDEFVTIVEGLEAMRCGNVVSLDDAIDDLDTTSHPKSGEALA